MRITEEEKAELFKLIEQAEQEEEAIPMVRESAPQVTPIHVLKCYLKALFDKDVHAAARQLSYEEGRLLPGSAATQQQECHEAT